MITPSSWKVTLLGVDLLNYFTAHSEGFIKFSFDGASKGNLSLVGLFRDHRTQTSLIYADRCGYDSNNESEYIVVRQGLQKAIKMGYRNIVFEWYFRLVINMVKKLNHETKWDRLNQS